VADPVETGQHSDLPFGKILCRRRCLRAET
jgi:hypothetical protein